MQLAAGTAASSGSGWMGEVRGACWWGVECGARVERRGDSIVQAMVKSAARTMGSTVGRQIIRGVLGSLLGGVKR